MRSVLEVLNLSAKFLEGKGIDRPRRAAEDLLASVLKCKRIDLYLHYDRPLVEEELSSMRELTKKCSDQTPVDYLIGEVEFFGCKIKTDRRALIPRIETEILVDLMVKKMGGLPSLKDKVFWDICTGSGCIGIALKKRFPELKVSLSDLSCEALQLAMENLRRNGVEIEVCEGDLLKPFEGRKADFIACNPPYITNLEYEGLALSVKEFEPKTALLAGEAGTEFYERMANDLPNFLNPGGLVFFEMGSMQKEALQKIFPFPFWRSAQAHLDWFGKDRFFFLEMQ